MNTTTQSGNPCPLSRPPKSQPRSKAAHARCRAIHSAMRGTQPQPHFLPLIPTILAGEEFIMQVPKTWAAEHELRELRQLVAQDIGDHPNPQDRARYARVVGIPPAQLERFLQDGLAKVSAARALACKIGRNYGIVLHGELLIPMPVRLIPEILYPMRMKTFKSYDTHDQTSAT